jgi:hypothetical protein
VHHGWHSTHRLDTQILATHVSTWAHWYSSLLQWSVHGHSVSVNCLYHARMVLSVGGSFVYFAQNARCTVTTNLLVWYFNTQNDFSPRAAIFSLHTLASPSGRNVNYDGKQLTGKNILELFLLSVQVFVNVSYSFRIINCCNSGLHYETPCIWTWGSELHRFFGSLQVSLQAADV